MQKVLMSLLLMALSAVLAQTAEQREAFKPPPELLAWLREHARPLQSATPTENNEDLLPLKEIVGDARIVALGEATHGTSEFFTIKHRIIQFLAEEMGFTVFSIEANMPEAYRVNEYVLTGEGDPRELLRDVHHLWIWNTQEVLDLILWMREYNASGRGVMQFTGFDMQNPTVAIEEARAFVEAYDPVYLAQLDRAYETVESVFSQGGGWNAPEDELKAWRNAAREVLLHLVNNEVAYIEANQSELAWAVQNARIVLQGAEFKLARLDTPVSGQISRDESMAANVEWILARYPEAKVVLWAHNAHIKESHRDEFVFMGERLSEVFGKDYFSLGFTFYRGDFQAQLRGGEEPQAYSTENAPEQSVEGVFHTLGLPLFLLDLRAGEQKQASWLATPRDTRTVIGTIANRYQLSFSKRQLPKEYDAIIFVDQMTPTDLLE